MLGVRDKEMNKKWSIFSRIYLEGDKQFNSIHFHYIHNIHRLKMSFSWSTDISQSDWMAKSKKTFSWTTSLVKGRAQHILSSYCVPFSGLSAKGQPLLSRNSQVGYNDGGQV